MQTKLKYIKDTLGDNGDFIIKQVNFNGISLDIVFLQNMNDILGMNDFVIKPIIEAKENSNFKQELDFYIQSLKNNDNKKFIEEKCDDKNFSHKVKEYEKLDLPKKSFSEFLSQNVLYASEINYLENEEQVIDEILRGNILIFINEGVEILKIGLIKYPERGIEEPPTSVVINGPRAGFNESLKTNITLVRRRLINKDLVVKDFFVGRYTKTKITLCYIKNIASDDIVKGVSRKISEIDVDGIIDSQYLVDYLSSRPYSLFKQVGKTEKPDILVAKMLEGRVGIMVDGSPICLTLPFIYLEDLQASDDYYQKNYKVSFVRFIRIFGSIIAMLLPGFYVALQQYHYRLIPLKFMVTIINSTEGLPLTPFLEILFVILLFEVLYESSIRMPKYLGMALSIVGALILGDTAVKAGLISPPAVMIVALSGITIYTAPDQAGQFSLLRLFFTLIGGILGIFGIIVGVLFILGYGCTIESYGVPYFAPIAPFIKNDAKDTIYKHLYKDMKMRPVSINSKNKRRQK